MAWIESFEVHGLAGRTTPVKHTLNRNLNIFWGLNGAGKTTLLKILHAALNNETAILEDLPFESARVTFRLEVRAEEARVVRKFDKATDVSSDSEDEGEIFLSSDISVDEQWVKADPQEDSGWETMYERVDIPPSALNSRFSHSYLPITRVSDRGQRFYDGARRRSSDEIFVEQVRERWRDYAAKSLTRIRDIQQQGLATVLAILFGGSPNAHGSSFGVDDVEPLEAYYLVRGFLSEQGFALRMEHGAFIERFQDSPEHRQVVAEIQTVKSQTEEVLTPQREFQSIIDSMYRGNKHLILAEPRPKRPWGMAPIRVEIGERAIPLKSLSSGEKQLLQILLEILSAAGNAVIIDEPELSLHVNWQQELVSSMRRINSECQLLLASHSPEIMADVADKHIFEL